MSEISVFLKEKCAFCFEELLTDNKMWEGRQKS